MQPTMEQLLSRLQEGETVEALLRSFIPQAEQELLKRCATVRMFDERMVDEIFRPEVEGGSKQEVTFDQLVQYGFVERTCGHAGFFQVRESSRKEYFELWRKGVDEIVPPALRQLSEKLVAYYRALGPAWEFDVLYHLIAVDGQKAEELFIRLYDAADSAFDLGRCNDLLKILEDRHTLLNRSLLELHKQRHYYLKARTLWSREHYQTAYYYEIEEFKNRFGDLLRDPQKWILQLYAMGGMGKTMFARWLIARYCVPQPLKIPCARIDFDYVNPVMATQKPWMLFLEIAQQLNEQIPGNLFAEQLGDLKEFKPMLARPDGLSQDLSKLQAAAELRKGLEDIPGRFVEALKAVPGDNKVVIIFDTLEEVILYQGTDMMTLLGEMKKIHDKYPNLCLILSGRYNLIEKLESFSETYSAVSEDLEIRPFSDSEARGYLKDKRGVNRLLDAIIGKARGNPLKLALYADIVRVNPRITEREIRVYPSDLLYLIRRVLLRIPDERVRWLLRYGVIPRKLRLSFIREVMAPYLPQAMSGKSSLDDPEKDIDQSLQPQNAFPKVLTSQVNVDDLWQKLSQYASSYSWVSPGDEPDTLSFHPDVVRPMRQLLRKHRIYRRLHRAAIKHYEKKAKENPADWGQWISEAVYHKFQLDGMAAENYWRKHIESAAAQKPEWRLALAREVANLARQADEAEQTGSTGAGDCSVSQALLAQAYFEIARADVEIARSSGVSEDALWNEASKVLTACEQLQSQLPKPAVSPTRTDYIRSAILVNNQDIEDAQAVLQNALKRRANAKDRINLELEYANVLSLQSKHREATRHYHAALMLAPKAKISALRVLDIKKELAATHKQAGELKKAAQEYSTALRIAEKSNRTRAILELSCKLADLYLDMGQPAKAQQYAFTQSTATIKYNISNIAAKSISKWKSRVELLKLLLVQGHIALALRDPLTALQKSTEAIKAVEIALSEGWQTPGENLTQLLAGAQELQGLISGELMENSKAIDELEQARSLYKETGDANGANRCLLHMIHIQLRKAGHIKAARFLLDQVERFSAHTDSDTWIRQELLRVDVLNLLERTRESQKRLDSLISRSKSERWSPRTKAAIALAAMVFRAQKSKGASLSARESVAMLKQVEPPSSRLMLLSGMRRCPTPRKVSSRLATAFVKLLPSPAWDKADGPFNAIKLAEVLRVVGKKRSPQSLLQAAENYFKEQNNLFALREVYQAWDRIGWSGRNVSALAPDISNFLAAYDQYPNLCANVLLEQAGRLLKFKEWDAAQQALDRAETYLGSQLGRTQWPAYLSELRGRLLVEHNLPRQTRKAQIDKSQEVIIKQGLRHLIQAKSLYDALENRCEVKRLSGYLAGEKKRLNVALGKHVAPRKAGDKAAYPSTVSGLSEQYAVKFVQMMNPKSRAYVVQMRRPPDSPELVIRTEAPGHDPQSRHLKMRSSSILPYILRVPPGDMIHRVFPKVFPEMWWGITREMSDLLLTGSAASRQSSPDRKSWRDFRLDIDDIQLAAIPWEFVTLNRRAYTRQPSVFDPVLHMYRSCSDMRFMFWAVTSLQSALQQILPMKIDLDGIYGPQTAQAVKMFQRNIGLPATGVADQDLMKKVQEALRATRREKPRVVIVQPSSHQQISASRGITSGGGDLASIYSWFDFNVMTVESPSKDMLIETLRNIPAQIIHLCAGMKRSPSVGIYLDFGSVSLTLHRDVRPSQSSRASSSLSERSSKDSSFFSPTSIGKLLGEFTYKHGSRPLVIVDVPRPPVLSEAIIQLLLRNAFAWEISRLGNTAAVLATGLMEPYEQQRPLSNLLVGSLAAFEPLGEIVNKMKSGAFSYLSELGEDLSEEIVSPHALEVILGYISTALFTEDPMISVQ